MIQRSLFDPAPAKPNAMRFDGSTYDHANDSARLTSQLARVFALMRDGAWRTLAEIAGGIDGGSEAGVSARLRDLRKPRFGGHVVERRHRGDPAAGLYEYRLIAKG